MFERRLKFLLLCLAVVLAVVVLRLIDLQVVHAAYYKQEAKRALLRPPKTLPFVRGRILDRLGNVLAQDEPRWNICLDFDVLTETVNADDGDAHPVNLVWDALADFSGETVEALRERGRRIVHRIDRIRAVVSRYHGYDVTIREQLTAHPIVTGLNDQQQIAARERFSGMPFVKIEHGAHRVYDRSMSLGHLLGRLGPVDAAALQNDPNGDEALARYLPTDRLGIAGVELLAERTLRGRRGRFQRNRRGDVIEDTPAVLGEDVSLTLRLDLQNDLYALLEEMIPTLAKDSPGGSIVVLHVPTREVLALVSYPGFDANEFNTRYEELRTDTIHTPWRFRAVANRYEPGSIVKPLTCLAGLGSGAITLSSTFDCDGYYLDNDRTKYRCWRISGTDRRKAHGAVTVEEAITGSCNLFMYHVADLVGVHGLTSYFEMAGFGEATGIGLVEETKGINPTPSWLNDRRGVPATAGRARNYAIGGGELSVTPLQAANLMAVYASGLKKGVSLIRSVSPPPSWELPAHAEHWAAIRSGLFRVTNDVNGTAYRTAHWSNGRFALCGKTGSATSQPKPISYRIRYSNQDGAKAELVIPAGAKKQAVKDFRRRFPDARFDSNRDVSVESVWPPPKAPGSSDQHSHAWFAGYLQRVMPGGQPILTGTPPIAFAVLVEFGGSGGYTAGPIARQVAQRLCAILGDELDPDTINAGKRGAS